MDFFDKNQLLSNLVDIDTNVMMKKGAAIIEF